MLLRLIDILLADLIARRVKTKLGGADKAGRQFAQAIQDGVDQVLPVDGIVDCQPNIMVIERRIEGAATHKEIDQRRPGHHLEVFPFTQARDGRRGRIGGKVDFARFNRRQHGALIRVAANDNLVEIGATIPVIFKGGQRHFGAGNKLFHLEGATANQVGVNVGLVLVERLRTDDDRRRVEEAVEIGGVGPFQFDDHGRVIRRADRFAVEGVVGVHVETFNIAGIFRVDLAGQAAYNGRRVDFAAVMELDSLANLEGVGQAICRNFPRLGQTRFGRVSPIAATIGPG